MNSASSRNPGSETDTMSFMQRGDRASSPARSVTGPIHHLHLLDKADCIVYDEVPSKTFSRGLLKYARNYTSRYGEDGILERIFQLLPGRERFCVDVGAKDGRRDSKSYSLLVSKPSQWSGLLLEADPDCFSSLRQLHDRLGNLCLNVGISCLEGSDGLSLSSLLDSCGGQEIPKDFDLLILSSDLGIEYWMLFDLWKTGRYFPRVVCIPFNTSMDTGFEFVPNRSEDRRHHRASLKSLNEMALENGYELVAVTEESAIFVQYSLYQECLASEVPDTSLSTLRPTSKLLKQASRMDVRSEDAESMMQNFYSTESRQEASTLGEVQTSHRQSGPSSPPTISNNEVSFQDRNELFTIPSRDEDTVYILDSIHQANPLLSVNSPPARSILKKSLRYGGGRARAQRNYCLDSDGSSATKTTTADNFDHERTIQKDPPDAREEYGSPTNLLFSYEPVRRLPTSLDASYGHVFHPRPHQPGCDPPMTNGDGTESNRSIEPIINKQSSVRRVARFTFDDVDQSSQTPSRQRGTSVEHEEALPTTYDWIKPSLFEGLRKAERAKLADQILKLEQWRNKSREDIDKLRRKISDIADAAERPIDQTTSKSERKPKNQLKKKSASQFSELIKKRTAKSNSLRERKYKLEYAKKSRETLPGSSNQPINAAVVIDPSSYKYSFLLDETPYHTSIKQQPSHKNKYLEAILGSRRAEDEMVEKLQPLGASTNVYSTEEEATTSRSKMLLRRIEELKVGSLNRPLKLTKGSGSSCLGSFSHSDSFSGSKNIDETSVHSSRMSVKHHSYSKGDIGRLASPSAKPQSFRWSSNASEFKIEGDDISYMTAAQEAEQKSEEALKSIEQSMEEMYVETEPKLSKLSSLTQTPSETLDSLLESESSTSDPTIHVRNAKERIIQRLKDRVPQYVPSTSAKGVVERQMQRLEKEMREKEGWYFSKDETQVDGPSSPSSPEAKQAWFFSNSPHVPQEESFENARDVGDHVIRLDTIHEVEYINDQSEETTKRYVGPDVFLSKNNGEDPGHCEDIHSNGITGEQDHTHLHIHQDATVENLSTSDMTLKHTNHHQSNKKTMLPDPFGYCYSGRDGSTIDTVETCKQRLEKNPCDIPDLVQSTQALKKQVDIEICGPPIRKDILGSCFVPNVCRGIHPTPKADPPGGAIDTGDGNQDNSNKMSYVDPGPRDPKFKSRRPSPLSFDLTELGDEFDESNNSVYHIRHQHQRPDNLDEMSSTCSSYHLNTEETLNRQQHYNFPLDQGSSCSESGNPGSTGRHMHHDEEREQEQFSFNNQSDRSNNEASTAETAWQQSTGLDGRHNHHQMMMHSFSSQSVSEITDDQKLSCARHWLL